MAEVEVQNRVRVSEISVGGRRGLQLETEWEEAKAVCATGSSKMVHTGREGGEVGVDGKVLMVSVEEGLELERRRIGGHKRWRWKGKEAMVKEEMRVKGEVIMEVV